MGHLWITLSGGHSVRVRSRRALDLESGWCRQTMEGLWRRVFSNDQGLSSTEGTELRGVEHENEKMGAKAKYVIYHCGNPK